MTPSILSVFKSAASLRQLLVLPALNAGPTLPQAQARGLEEALSNPASQVRLVLERTQPQVIEAITVHNAG